MNPFYFGDKQKRLFGVYHPPNAAPRDCGVVLCQPLHEEYAFSHRAMRGLAIRLAKEGIPSLRFDYYGSGDSAGDGSEVSVAQCREDILTASRELMDISGVSKVSLVGLRMGALVAAWVACEISSIDKVILWDPVFSGNTYLDELKFKHDEALKDISKQPINGDLSEGLYGHSIPKLIQLELEGFDFTTIRKFPKNKIYVVYCEDISECNNLNTYLYNCGINVISEFIPSHRIWEDKSRGNNELVPNGILQCITSWISQR